MKKIFNTEMTENMKKQLLKMTKGFNH